jgi:hypothetical protein
MMQIVEAAHALSNAHCYSLLSVALCLLFFAASLPCVRPCCATKVIHSSFHNLNPVQSKLDSYVGLWPHLDNAREKGLGGGCSCR